MTRPTPRVFEAQSVEETEQFAAHLAPALSPGTVIALHGEMGTGKTHFVRGLVQGLGGNANLVSSPTFVLLNVYDTLLRIFHLDAYRVSGPEDFEAIGFTELLEQNGLVIVEWPQRVQALLPLQTLHVHLTAIGENVRTISVH
ncbi:MAG TPA: tRNA (adenosine(37)-N6)-threonylcarbamoyltransferase complex ATPase subunit type 1 TsaE [Tepidisphaeraceae bacterium]|jgi:tRNA threonylcarbamoyladenosine biosynthesis protein TsaE